ncbi:MAG: Maf family nucleotide pyrophosphatase [Pseudomonadota bacterium]
MSAVPRPPFILASASPRRRDLLAQIGLVPDEILPADIDETPLDGEAPRALAGRLSLQKAGAIQAEGVVLAADTVVAVGRRILPKAETEDEARACLALLSGRSHHVFTGIAVSDVSGRVMNRTIDSVVTFKRLSQMEIEAYIKTGDWDGKAGGYAIQGPAGAFIPKIRGSYSAIVGLPLFETRNLLQAAGISAP